MSSPMNLNPLSLGSEGHQRSCYHTGGMREKLCYYAWFRKALAFNYCRSEVK